VVRIVGVFENITGWECVVFEDGSDLAAAQIVAVWRFKPPLLGDTDIIAAEIIGLVLDAGGQITADGPDLVLPYGRRSRTTPRLLAALPDKAGPVDSLPISIGPWHCHVWAHPYQNFGISVKKVTDFLKGLGLVFSCGNL